MRKNIEVIAVAIALLALLVAILNWLAPFGPIGPSPFAGQETPTTNHPSSVTVDIDSRKGWQSTDLRIDEGTKAITIEEIKGQWTDNKSTVPYHSGAGGPYTCGNSVAASQCLEVLTSEPNGMLIGQIGGSIFAIGTRHRIESPSPSGILFLRMNDNDLSLDDNDGVLTVRITVER
jgi:hypothetical protein